jgi:hypothetical protein
LILYFERKKLPNLKVFILSVMAFLVAFIPQGLFELRHPGVLSGALYQFIFHEKTFTFSFWQILKDRIPYDYNLFYSKFWINGGKLFAPFFVIFIALMIFGWKQFWKDDKFKIVFILSVAPFVGTLFFIGNLGAIYDYYFTGYYLIWILLFSIVFIRYSNRFLMKIVLFVFLIILFTENIYAFHINYSVPLTDQNTIAFTNQTDAISWIYKDAGRRQFNVDEYVPPVIPYTYNYLFTWFPTTPRLRGAAGTLVENQVPLLYTLYEVDPPHPERLQAWLDRQKGIGKVIKQATFGGITVQERERIIKK